MLCFNKLTGEHNTKKILIFRLVGVPISLTFSVMLDRLSGSRLTVAMMMVRMLGHTVDMCDSPNGLRINPPTSIKSHFLLILYWQQNLAPQIGSRIQDKLYLHSHSSKRIKNMDIDQPDWNYEIWLSLLGFYC